MRFDLIKRGAMLAVASIAVCSPASAATRAYVADGAPNNSACTKAQPCGDINYALYQVDPDGTVVITDSEIYRPFLISKPVTVTAANGQRPVIRGTDGVVVSVGVSDWDEVNLRGLQIRNRARDLGVGVKIYGSRGDITLEDVTISHTSSGVYADGFKGNLEVTGSKIENNSFGIVDDSFTGRAIIEKSKFRLNYTRAIRFGAGKTMIDASRFISGGPVQLGQPGVPSYFPTGVITDSRFIDNYAAIDGSEIFVGDSVFAFNPSPAAYRARVFTLGGNKFQGGGYDFPVRPNQ
jgi:hypothetical protein